MLRVKKQRFHCISPIIKDALVNNPENQRVIDIGMQLDETNSFLRIMVKDNGEGIPEEICTKIFTHGFTTKKKGNGFGLHSGALTAKELGGALEVHSDGPAQGAIFTLSLPVAPAEVAA